MSRRRQPSRPYWAHSEPEQEPATVTVGKPSHGPCPGICNKDWRKALLADNDKPPAVVPGHPIWCQPCTKRIARSLLGLPEAFVQLELDKVYGTPNPADRGDGKKPVASAPPSSSPAADAQDELVRWLVTWETVVREGRGLVVRTAVLPRRTPPPDRWFVVAPDGGVLIVFGPWPQRPRSIETMAARRESVTTMAAVKFLTTHLEWLLASDSLGPVFGREVLDRASKLRRRARLDEQRSRKPVPCPRCALKTLVHEGGETYVSCENPIGPCGRLLSMDEYDDLQADWLQRTKPGRAVTAC